VPVIVNPDPLSAGASAAGALATSLRQKQLTDAAARHQQQREQRQDMEADRSFGLQQGEAADAHQRTQSEIANTQSEIASRQLEDTIRQANEAQEKILRPLRVKAEQAQVKLAQGEVVSQADLHAMRQYDLVKAKIDAQIAQQTGLKAAQLGLTREQAEIAATNARTVATQAETAETYKRTSLLGTSGYGSGGGRGGRAALAQSAYDDAMQNLSPKAQAFMDMLYGTNNPPTRAQAMMALGATRRGGGLTDADRKNLATIIDNRETQFESPGQQRTEGRYEERTQAADQRHQHSDAEQTFHDLARGKAYNALPPRLKEMVRHVMVDQGLTVEQALQSLPGAPIPDEDKAALTRALSGR
jgi:hypothetical protein